MEIRERKIKGVFEITLQPHRDERGFFMRTFDEKLFEQAGINRHWVQENHALSMEKGIVRGMHFQLPPDSETKMVHCVKGAVLDVFVDIRLGSPTFGQWDSIELSMENKKMIFIPRGFAHGYCTLTDISEVLYKVDNFYAPQSEAGIKWNDPQLGIDWPVKDAMLSAKDEKNLSFNEFINKYKGIKI